MNFGTPIKPHKFQQILGVPTGGRENIQDGRMDLRLHAENALVFLRMTVNSYP